MKHITWTYPIVAQTPKEDFIHLGKDAGEGEIISVKGNSKIHVLKSIWRENIHVHGRGFPLPELACLFAKKSIYSPHNDTIGARYLTRIVRRLVFNRYDKIITQTEYGKGQLIEAGIKPEKITLIPSVVDYSYFSKPKGGNEFRKRYGLGKEPFVLVVGIRSVKNPLVIANACERSGVKVVMIGPYEKSDLEATWKAKGFEWYMPPEELKKKKNVILTGQLSGKDLLAAMDAATIFAHSSDYECFGLVVYEAAAAGLPLCLPYYGTFDVFRQCALFHKKDDEKALSDNINIYLNNPKIIAQNSRKAKIISKGFDYPIIKRKYYNLYKTLKFVK